MTVRERDYCNGRSFSPIIEFKDKGIYIKY